jgi:hypothetical protein
MIVSSTNVFRVTDIAVETTTFRDFVTQKVILTLEGGNQVEVSAFSNTQLDVRILPIVQATMPTEHTEYA